MFGRFKPVLVLAVVLSGALLVGCDMWSKDKSDDNKMSHENHGMGVDTQKSLYDRLGGEPAISAVCDEFVNIAASDPNVDFFRKSVPGHEWKPTPEQLATFKKHLVQFVASAAGGPQKY